MYILDSYSWNSLFTKSFDTNNVYLFGRYQQIGKSSLKKKKKTYW